MQKEESFAIKQKWPDHCGIMTGSAAIYHFDWWFHILSVQKLHIFHLMEITYTNFIYLLQLT